MTQFVWQRVYEAAIIETNPTLIGFRIADAENAILDRLEDEIHGRCALDSKERQAIENARKLLGTLRHAYAA